MSRLRTRFSFSPERATLTPLAMRLLAASMALGLHPAAYGQNTAVWDGSDHQTGTDWATKQNWSPSRSVPTGIDTAAFGSVVGAGSPIIGTSTAVGKVLFNSGAATFVITAASGQTLTLNGVASAGIVNNATATETLNLGLILGGSQTWQAAAGAIHIGGPVNLGASNLTIDGGSGTTLSGSVSGSGALLKTGAGTLTLTATNSFTGATTISGGTLSAGTTGALQSTSAITVNNTGTLLLAGAGSINRISDTAAFNLAGGTLSTAGLSSAHETLGTLTLSAISTIDFGTGTGDWLSFTSVGTHTAGTSLSILGWSGTASTLGTTTSDRLIFTGTTTDFTSRYAQADISFAGFGTGYTAIQFGGQFEIVAVPEPTTIFGAVALIGLVGYRERRRLLRGKLSVES